MTERHEVVLYFKNVADADQFVAKHVMEFSDHWISPEVTGYAVRELRYPDHPGEPLEIRVSRYWEAHGRREADG